MSGNLNIPPGIAINGVPHLIKTLTCFGRNSPSPKFQIFIEAGRKTDKTNKSSSGKSELCWKRDGWDGLLGLSHVSLWKSAGYQHRVPAAVPARRMLQSLLPKQACQGAPKSTAL